MNSQTHIPHHNLWSRLFMLLPLIAAVSCREGTASPSPLPSLTSPPPIVTEIPASLIPATPLPTLAAPTEVPLSISGVSAISYVLPLTVQHVTETTALVFFELDTASAGVVLVSPMEDSSPRHVVFDSDTRHLITLTGLTAGTTYEVAVGLGTEETDLREPGFSSGSWGSIHLTTASDESPLRVGVIGDSGFGDPATFALAVAMAAYKVDFVIQMGDAVYRVDENDSPAEAFSEKWYLPFSALLHEMPVYPVVGNHDVEPATRNDQGLPFYYEAFPSFDETASGSQRRWASFGRNGVQFLLLDTQAFYGEADNEAQSSWLAERLSDTQYKYSIPAFHIPPFSSDIVHSQDGLPVRAWTSLFEQANVPLVLSGHAHNYERLEQNGVTYIVSGGGSQALYASGVIAPQSKVFISQTHFTLLEIYEEHLDITAISRDGDILDQKTISTP